MRAPRAADEHVDAAIRTAMDIDDNHTALRTLLPITHPIPSDADRTRRPVARQRLHDEKSDAR